MYINLNNYFTDQISIKKENRQNFIDFLCRLYDFYNLLPLHKINFSLFIYNFIMKCLNQFNVCYILLPSIFSVPDCYTGAKYILK